MHFAARLYERYWYFAGGAMAPLVKIILQRRQLFKWHAASRREFCCSYISGHDTTLQSSYRASLPVPAKKRRCPVIRAMRYRY